MRDDLDREGAGKVMSLKFIITSDLHQNIAKWRDLVRVVKQTKLRFVLVAGDILPKDGGVPPTQTRAAPCPSRDSSPCSTGTSSPRSR